MASNWALVAPAFTATARPWISSAASSPTMCTPTTLSVAASTISFMKVRWWRPDTVYFIGRKAAVKTRISPRVSLASSSVSPTLASSGWQNTVDGTGAGLVKLHAHLLEPDARRVGRAAGGVHHDVGLEHAAQRRVHLVGRFAAGGDNAADLHLGAHLDAAVFQGLVHCRAALLVEAAQHAVAAQHQVDVAAEAVEDAGELDGDVAAAHDRDALGQRIGQMERLVGRDGEFLAGNLRHDGVAAGRDQDLLRGDRLLANLNRVAVHQPASTHVQLDARAFEQPQVDAVQAIDFFLHVVAQGRPRVARRRDGPAIGRGVLEFVRELGAVDQELLRHATADHAGAADPVVLADADARAVAGGDARGAHAARAGADDEKVVVVGHVDNLRTKPQHGRISVPPQTISALRRPGKGNGACISVS